RAEDVAAAFHARLSRRAVPRSSSPFLPVGLGPTARDFASCFGARVALARVGQLAEVCLVHDGDVRRFREDRLGEVDLAVALAEGIEERHLERFRLRRFLGLLAPGGRGGFGCRHQTFLGFGLPAGPLGLTFLVDCLTRTSAPLAPGTPPLTMSRFLSASTRTTL